MRFQVKVSLRCEKSGLDVFLLMVLLLLSDDLENSYFQSPIPVKNTSSRNAPWQNQADSTCDSLINNFNGLGVNTPKRKFFYNRNRK